ncbi:chemotaxis protein MotA [Sphingomonas jejuensis]|uniref:Chemotaxis protein MotA n=1 Tax=Sphingomonas jejuensis TaxID=904715 RepID=A0ABX0XQ11_9SPHN|nr:MotA/TolQ/ExbB proton channel family protein [Sphingomonas jejuensis]NJC34760.1 chemotaxis protein MotA [Sphingomonas jejuensis]
MTVHSIPLSSWPTFVDPLAIAIVVGGTALATLLRGPAADALAAVRALPRLGRRGFDAERLRAEIARTERVAVTRGLLNVDADGIADRCIADVVRAVVDGAGPDQVTRLIDDQDHARDTRHRVIHAVWMAAAEAAPAMGMIGTLVGLVRMFSRMDDPTAIGGAMAVALLTTLYGAILANLVAAPIAARLARLSTQEAAARNAVRPALIDFARRFAPVPIVVKRPRTAA